MVVSPSSLLNQFVFLNKISRVKCVVLVPILDAHQIKFVISILVVARLIVKMLARVLIMIMIVTLVKNHASIMLEFAKGNHALLDLAPVVISVKRLSLVIW